MSYRTRLEARIARKTTKAIVDFDLIEDGDRVVVGVSGGKDSWALLQILDVLRRHARIDFSLTAVTVDSGYADFKHEVIAQTCEERGWAFRIEHTRIGETIDDLLEPGDTPCSLCGRLRRGVLYRVADEIGAGKIALGHHADDVIETLLLNLFYEGTLKAMPARLVSDNGNHVVIRPLVYVHESEASAYAKECGLPVVSCCCSACGDLSLKRHRMKRLLLDLERENPGVKNSLVRAVGNVALSHLLDVRALAVKPGSRSALETLEEARDSRDTAPFKQRDEAERGVRAPASEELGGVQGPPPFKQRDGAERGVRAPASEELGGVQRPPPFKQ